MKKVNPVQNSVSNTQKSKAKSNQSSSITVHKLQINPNQNVRVRVGFKKLWNIVPLFVKLMSLSTLSLYLLNLFFSSISYCLSNIPHYTIFHIHLWRLISSVLMTTSIFNVILGLIFWAREGSSIETRLGTMKYIIIFLRNTLLIEILYTLIIYLVSLIIKKKDFTLNKINNKGAVRNCGFWPVIMCEVTLLCICNPNTRVKFLSIPWEFSAKYYPLIWFVLFCSFNNYNNDIEVFTGVLFAFIYQYGLRYYLNISDKFIEKMENNICCKWMLKITGFVSVSHITNKFMDEKLNQRMTGQILNLNKAANRKKDKSTGSDSERNVKITSEYTNRSENSMISNATPPSLFDTSFGNNKSSLP
jgi:hypothetical protein